MSEVVKQISNQQSPLQEAHKRLGAEMKERDGCQVAASFGDELFEYAIVRERGAGVIDLSQRGRFQLSGSEVVQFLNGLITNDMKTLAENQWMPAIFPNVQGRLLAYVRVVRIRDGFLIDTEATTHDTVLKTIERFTLAGDFHVVDLTKQTAMLSVQGKQADEIVGAVLGKTLTELSGNGVVEIEWQQHTLTVLRASHTAEDGFDIIAGTDQAPVLWEALTNAGARPIGYEAFERLRIEAGVPRYGVDMDETNVVTETGLDEAVSYTKGCYIGQEIIARIKYRGHVAKKLVGLAFDRTLKIGDEPRIKSADDKEIGRLTSVTLSPHLGYTIALGYVKYDYLAAGTEVRVTSSSGDLHSRVAELPFVKKAPLNEKS
ncbi:MAG TPA: glycine cleavage T C-terminal barrel domain-containing protein [Pyrinomonadaceae bacterium]|nr:glycine cleavage T C-terminal barrel domain-containing protein [Pyrinomonadaceae bacterium]